MSTESITFEQGYNRLQQIAERVNSDSVPVHEMCELFAEGKGLGQALSGYLDQQKSRVEAIERGEGLRAFRVEAPGERGKHDPEAPAGATAESRTPAAATTGSNGIDRPATA